MNLLRRFYRAWFAIGRSTLSLLYLICAEGFSALLNAAEANGFLSGVKICQQATSINHLLFADDSPLRLKIDDRSAHHLQNILTLYEDCSGQTINKDKSSIMFSKNAKAAHNTSIDGWSGHHNRGKK